jgi:WhiB family transcriptional regulator, redox-sensing transcriptional regulator
MAERAQVGAWMNVGRCRDLPPSLFFPSSSTGVAEAKRYCAGCPVNRECLQYALDNGLAHGVWGGTSERERRRLARRQGQPRSTHVELVNGPSDLARPR